MSEVTKKVSKKVVKKSTKKVTTKSELLQLIADGKFDKVIKLNPLDYMAENEKSKLNLDSYNSQIKGLFLLKENGFNISDSILALSLFNDITEIRLAIKNVIFSLSESENKDGFYNMYENLTDMESMILVKDGITRVYNSVMKFKHRKQNIPKGKTILTKIKGKIYSVDENQVKFLKYHISNEEHLIKEILHISTLVKDEDILTF